MALEHMVWLTPKAGVSDDKMAEILASIRALTHIPGVLAISAGQNITKNSLISNYHRKSIWLLISQEQTFLVSKISKTIRTTKGLIST